MIQRSKPINQQVVFISGATSSIGIATIRLAVKNGARVYMVGDNEEKLQTIQDEMRSHNLPTAYAVAQCSEFDQLQIAVEHCIDTFGIIDTWINIAVLPFDASIPEFREDEFKLFFEVNFWGVVNLCKLAMGGSIVLVGTALIEKNIRHKESIWQPWQLLRNTLLILKRILQSELALLSLIVVI